MTVNRKVNKSQALRQKSTRGRKTKREFDLEAWAKRGREVVRSANDLGKKHDNTQWALGDWLIEGEHGIRPRLFRAEAKKITDYTWGTLKNFMVVSRGFKPSRRRDTLTYSHHQEVLDAEIDERTQDKLLDEAVKKKSSIRDLRKAITEKKNIGVLPMSEKVPVIRVELDKESYAEIAQLAHYAAHTGAENTTPANLLVKYAFLYLKEHPEERRKLDHVKQWRDAETYDNHSVEAERSEASTVAVL